MNRYKRFYLLLAVVLVLPFLLRTQPVEARRGVGFSASNGSSALHGLALACVDGVEFAFTLDNFVKYGHLGKIEFSDTVIIVVEAAIYKPNSYEIDITGPFTKTFTLNRHDPVPLENAFYASHPHSPRAIAYSASDSIPDGNAGNISFKWSDFGLSTPTPGDYVKLSFSTVNATSTIDVPPWYLNIYLNSGSQFYRILIEDCKGDVFPAPPPTCMNEKVDVRSQELPIPIPAGYYRQTIQPNVSSGLQSSSVDIMGRVKREFPSSGSRSPLIQLLVPGESSLYIETWAPDTVSPDGYMYSHEWEAASGFAPITLTVSYDAAKTYAYPKHLVFYDTYASSVEAINVVRPLSRFVDDALGFNTAMEHFAFPPLAAPTTISITAIYVDNQDVTKPIRVGASAGGVTASQTDAMPNIGSGLNLIEMTLHDVPRGTSELDFTIESPAGNGDTALLTGIVLSYPCLEAVDNVAEIRETRTAPLIDGLVDSAWQSASSYALKSLLIGDGPLTAADFSVNFRSLYDSDNLYVLIETTDDALYNDSGDQLESDDTVKLYLDPNFSQGLTYDNVDDRATFFRWNDPVTYKSPQSPTLPPGLQKSIVNTTNGYLVELRLPLSEIGLPPTPGYLFGLDVHVHDDDNGGEQEHKLAWNTLGSGIHRNPSLMGIGRLIAAANTLPIANDDAATTQQNTTLNGTSVLANDSDPDGDLLTVTPISGPSNGSLVLNSNGTYVYTPNQGFVGNDSFAYEVSDGKGGSDTATVTITITAQPVNRPPVANDDAATVQQNTTLNGTSVLANDSDPDGDLLTVTVTPISGPSNGSLALNGNGSYVYTPNPGFVGNDSFVYEVSDGKGGNDTATVRISVQQSNRPPVANPDSATTAQDTTLNGPSLLANDSDPDGDLLTINTTPVTGPTNGTLVLNANGTYVYRPTGGFVGTDRFTYAVSDGNGGSSTATVNIAITAVLGTSSSLYYLPFIVK